jgi:hypothetical protein
MKTNRNDIYARIHKGLRKALFEFSEQTGKTNPANNTQIDSLIDMGKKVFEFLELHAEVEEKFQLPYLAAINPLYVSEDKAEHQKIENQIENLKREMFQIKGCENDTETLYQFYLNLNEFIGTYLLHMHHEETITAGYFIHHCQREEMNRIVNDINTFTTPDQKFLALSYFMPAISHPERIEFLTEIKAKNQAAYENILAETQAILSIQDWETLFHALDDIPAFSWFGVDERQFLSS